VATTEPSVQCVMGEMQSPYSCETVFVAFALLFGMACLVVFAVACLVRMR
jgi:hypothetical protein